MSITTHRPAARDQSDRAQPIANISTWELDLATLRLTWSDDHYRLLGLEPTGALLDGFEGMSYIHCDDLPTVRSAFEAAIAQKGSFELELRVVWPDGSIHWIRSHGQVLAQDNSHAERMVGTAVEITEQKAVQKALRASEVRYLQFLETAQEGIWILDAGGGTTFANARRAAMLGCGIDHLGGRGLLDFLVSADQEEARQSWDDFDRAHRQQREVHFRRVDGSDLWALVSTRQTLDASGVVVETLATVTDITERKRVKSEWRPAQPMVSSSLYAVTETPPDGFIASRSLDAQHHISDQSHAEAALWASEQRLRTVLEHAPLVLFALDRHGRYAVRAGRGLSEDVRLRSMSADLQSHSFFELFADHPRVQAIVRRALAGESFTCMIEVDNRTFECAYDPDWGANGVLNGTLGVATDVTERERARQDVERMRYEHELILRSAGEAMFRQDRDGLATFINPAAARLLGWKAEELLGRDMHATLHGMRNDGSAYPHEACPIHAAIADGATHHSTGELFWRHDGTSFPVEYFCTPTRDASRISGAVVTFKDISERLAAEVERAGLYQQVLERDRALQAAAVAIPRSTHIPLGIVGEQDGLARLTPRERDVLQWLARGQSNADIARSLGVGRGTVKNHVEHVLRKLGLASRTQVALWADRLGPQVLSR